MTHLATADGDLAFAAGQLEVFAPFAAELQRRYGRLRVHAANSAGTLRVPGAISTWCAAASPSTVVTR